METIKEELINEFKEELIKRGYSSNESNTSYSKIFNKGEYDEYKIDFSIIDNKIKQFINYTYIVLIEMKEYKDVDWYESEADFHKPSNVKQ